DRPSNEIGDDLADHDKNDVKHEQFHSDIPRSIPCGSPRKPPTLGLILPTRTRRVPIKMVYARGPPHSFMPNLAEISMRLRRLAIVMAAGLFVVLWSKGFIGAGDGVPDIEPLAFLAVRMDFVVLIMAAIAIIGDVARWGLLTSEQSQVV